MLLDARNTNEVPDKLEATTVLIGGGTIGLYMALTLARARIPVLVCEAAGLIADTNRNELTAASIGKTHDGVKVGRAFGLGGTSILWGGQLAEFEPTDVAKNCSWPIEFSELRRRYDEVYEFLSVQNISSVETYRKRFGREEHSEEDVERFFTYWLPQPNFALLFHKEILSNPFLTIILNAPVGEISFAGDIASSVAVRTANGRKIAVAGRRFIFAMGTIESNRFFLSTQRTSAVPWRENRTVGSYFQDHLAGRVATASLLNDRRFRNFFENGFVDGLKLQPKLRFAPHTRNTVLNGVCGAFAFDSTLSESLWQIKALARSLKSGVAFSDLAGLPANLWTLSYSMLPLVARYVRDRRIMAFFDRGLAFHVQSEQIPNRESKIVLLDGPPGSDGLFRAGVDWRIDGQEISAINVFTRQVDAYLQKWDIARLQIDEDLSRNDSVFLAKLSDTYHQCGGLRMANYLADGVVDANCCVWGTRNVYVAGASVFPTSSHANSTLTALALAARLVAQLRASA
jgi:choline dehydrogenase-like flavoprotein